MNMDGHGQREGLASAERVMEMTKELGHNKQRGVA
jgi:hypothetical protein